MHRRLNKFLTAVIMMALFVSVVGCGSGSNSDTEDAFLLDEIEFNSWLDQEESDAGAAADDALAVMIFENQASNEGAILDLEDELAANALADANESAAGAAAGERRRRQPVAGEQRRERVDARRAQAARAGGRRGAHRLRRRSTVDGYN